MLASSDRPIDPDFDFFSDTPDGRDPDESSPTLRRYHQILWSKPLSSGATVTLEAPMPKRDEYLVWRRESSPLWFGSDAITNSYKTWSKPGALANAVASLDQAQRDRYLDLPYTVGQVMIWPVRSATRPTINQARGTRSAIADRMDLTLECVRRHFVGGATSPLSDVLSAYGDYFELFAGFDEFVSFFHLEDLVSADYSTIQFLLPFDDFAGSAVPLDVPQYVSYREATLEFATARVERMTGSIERALS